MPRVRFLHDFDWHVPERGGAVTVHFKAGREYLVTRACAAAATAKGTAALIQPGKARRPDGRAKAAEPPPGD